MTRPNPESAFSWNKRLSDATGGVIRSVEEAGGSFDDLQSFLASPRAPQIGQLVMGTLKLAQPAVWPTITIGAGPKTGKAYARKLKQAGCRVSDWAAGMLTQPAFVVGAKKQELDLVVVSGHDLGFTESTTRAEIYKAGLARGYELCPPEVGPALCLQYKDQPVGEWLLVAMEPITDSDGGLGVFDVEHDGGDLWLNGHDGNPDYVWDPRRRWVFVRPRK